MKWFKHENTFNNPKIEVLTELYGIEGYGVYFALLELIASHIEKDNQPEWGFLPREYTMKYLAKKLHMTEEKLEEIVLECEKLSLFILKDERLHCPKILERCDDYFSRIKKQTTNNVQTNKEQTTSIEEEQEIEQEIEQEEEKEVLNNDEKISDEISEEKSRENEIRLRFPKPSTSINHAFQAQAMDIIKALDVPDDRKSAYFKACKEEPRALILEAYSFAADHKIPSARDKMFFFRLNQLKSGGKHAAVT